MNHPQSRMVPVVVAGLVGVLLGALIVLVGILSGQRACPCERISYAPERISYAPTDTLIYYDEAQPVPVPSAIALLAAGLIAWRLS